MKKYRNFQRIPWKTARRRHKGTQFMEESSFWTVKNVLFVVFWIACNKFKIGNIYLNSVRNVSVFLSKVSVFLSKVSVLLSIRQFFPKTPLRCVKNLKHIVPKRKKSLRPTLFNVNDGKYDGRRSIIRPNHVKNICATWLFQKNGHEWKKHRHEHN